MTAAGHSRSTPAVRARDVSYAYRDGRSVVTDISFSVAAGETVVLCGLSGCGKTTLCHCLTGLAPKALGGTLRGSVQIMGQEIATLPLPQISSRIGLVFQDPDNQMVTATVEDEIAFAPENLALDPREIRRRVDRQLERFAIAPLSLRAPNRLSGGEKHLVALASVLALNPPVIILDEPLAHLDEHGRLMVREALLELRAEGRTLLIVEHDLSLLDFSDRYLLMEEGRLVSETVTPPPSLLDTDEDAVEALLCLLT